MKEFRYTETDLEVTVADWLAAKLVRKGKGRIIGEAPDDPAAPDEKPRPEPRLKPAGTAAGSSEKPLSKFRPAQID